MAKKKINYSLAKKVSQKAALTETIDKVLLSERKIVKVEVEKLIVNPFQPRISMNLAALNELAASIENEGMLQPIIVSNDKKNLIIVAGHRRVEAIKLLDKKYIDAIVLDNIEDEQLAILPLIENLQRENTDPIENAIAFKKLIDQKIVNNQIQLAELIGCSKSWLSKSLSILKLPPELISELTKDEYKDITVMAAMNKLSHDNIISVYNKIKFLNRYEALEYIKNLSSKTTHKNTSNIVQTKNKVVVNFKNLDDKKIKKIDLLIKEIEKIVNE